MPTVDFRGRSDKALAEAIRGQMRHDLLSLQNVPPMQQMMAEAIARILERPLVVLSEVKPGEMKKAADGATLEGGK